MFAWKWHSFLQKAWQFREMPNFKKQTEDSDLQIATGKGGSVVRRVVLIVFLVGTIFS